MMNQLRYVGNENQLLTARRITFRDDVAEGVRAIELRNSSGLSATCLEDQCLDLFDLSFKGINISYQTKNGLMAHRFFNGTSGEFGYHWRAGMLYTCGLSNAGASCKEGGLFHAPHGRIGVRPAKNVRMERDEKGVTISGTIRDSAIANHQLDLERTVFFPAEGKEITICDTVVNREALPAEYMLLYHFNLGHPLLAPGCRVVKGEGPGFFKATGGELPADWDRCYEPGDHKNEELFCHRNTADADGFAYAALINDELGLGCYVKYSLDTLPLLMHWRSMCAHDYVIGLEPSNSYILGRTKERENGTLPKLDGYGKANFKVGVGVLEGKEEIAAFEAMLKSL